ncbi:MAG: hypothetical protein ACRD0C_03425 [Acidimicrobiia bacterium]
MRVARRGVRLSLLVLAVALAGASPQNRVVAAQSTPLTAQDDVVLRTFLSGPGARTVCVRLDEPDVEGVACADRSRLMREDDPADDYFPLQIQGSARARNGAELKRIKLRLGVPRGEIVQWQPGQDYFPKEESPFQAEHPMTGRRLDVVFQPGRIHP